jgi:membrane-associated phospholipid phosphatase
MVLLVAFSRVYLGAHYVSDVLAAMAESVAWLAVCITAISTLRRRREGKRYKSYGSNRRHRECESGPWLLRRLAAALAEKFAAHGVKADITLAQSGAR